MALEKDNDMLQEVLSETQTFSQVEELQGDAWSGIKNQVSAHDMVIKGLTCMNDAMMRSGKQLFSLCGEEDLDEEKLENQIEGLENTRTSYQDAIDSYNYYMKNEIYEFCFGNYARGQIELYQNLINYVNEEIKIAKEKLDDIERIDNATKELTTETEQLQQAVLQGIEYLKSTWTGSGFTVSMVQNLEWMSTINKAWENRVISIENASLSMLAQYGFTVEQYKLIEKTFLELEREYGSNLNREEVIHDIFKVLAPLCINYDAKRFRMTAGTLEVDEAIKDGIDFANYANGEIYTNYEISFKGDIDSTRWGWDFSNGTEVDKTKVDWGDFTSDADAINIYERMKNFDNGSGILETINNYNYGLSTGEIKRSTEFLSNLGDGNIGDGILVLDKILSADSIGSHYIQGENSEKKVQAGKETFVQWVMEGYLKEKGN